MAVMFYFSPHGVNPWLLALVTLDRWGRVALDDVGDSL